ncbi:MAG: hypothetical protein ACLSVD_01550 [Eggerthellaceae bacterium]
MAPPSTTPSCRPGGDPDYYLSHDIYRSWNPYGCPYGRGVTAWAA